MLKRFRVILSLLLIFGFSAMLVGKEGTDTYFPHAIGSSWVYEDADGNQFTRRAVKAEEIEGKTYRAFTYEPTVADWADYEYYLQPYFYQGGEDSVVFFVGDEVEKATKARLTKEAETFRKVFVEMLASPEAKFDLLSEVEVEAQDSFYVLPTSGNFNEKWDAMQIKAKITMTPEPLVDPGAITLQFTIVETGKVLGTENVETPAGTFENCLKIEYQTETKVESSPPDQAPHPPGESVTTLWVVPNVGIVKFHQKTEDILLKVIPLPQFEASPTVKTLELKKYEVKSADSGGE